MKLIKISIAALILTLSAQFAGAQVRVGVGIHIGDPYPYRRVVYEPHPVYYPQPVYYPRAAYYPRTVVYRGGYHRAYWGRPSYRSVVYGPGFRGRGHYHHDHGRGHGRHR